MRQIILALLATLVGMSILTAAPVPKKPSVLIAEHLNDTRWDYKFRDSNGFICFNKDGTYFSKHQDNGVLYVGHWFVNRYGTICLEEYYCTIGSGTKVCWYFKLGTQDFPTLKGHGSTTDDDAATTTVVVLSNPVTQEN